MEKPKQMLSEIIENDSVIIISTPTRKSWVLIILFTVLTIEFAAGIIQSLFFGNNIPTGARIFMLVIFVTLLYFVMKGLLWQLRGEKEVRINSEELQLSKLSPLSSKVRTYKLAEIKSIDIRDESVSIGPLGMLQLLGITDKIKITFTYGYETITANSGIDMTEAIEIKNRLQSKINR